MSSRWYPLFHPGNPQLRVFLPNFWMKAVKPQIRLPPHMAHFHVPPEMSDYDIKNYLTKIYNLPVVHVHSEIMMGSLGIPDVGGITKKEDYRLAQVTFRRDFSFTFPDLIQEEQREKERKEIIAGLDDIKKASRTSTGDRPAWFS